MAIKGDGRYRIDTLLRIAKTTQDDILREECCSEAKNLIDDLDATNEESLNVYFQEFCEIDNHSKNDRRHIYIHYNNLRQERMFPYVSRQYFYQKLREFGATETKSHGYYYVNVKVKK